MVTRRQVEVAARMAFGDTYAEAGRALNIDAESVKTHLRHARQLTGTRNTTELVAGLLVNRILWWDVKEGQFRPNRELYGD